MPAPETLIDRYTAAAIALDREALLALYHDDILLYDLMLPWQISGTGAWSAKIDSWFSGVGSDPVVEASDVAVTTLGEAALLTMTMHYGHTDEDGTSMRMANRLTWVAVAAGDDWKILHEHTSVPLDEQTMSPQFQRES